MESNSNYYKNVNNIQIQSNEPANPNSKTGKIIDNYNIQQESYDFYDPSEKEKEKDNSGEDFDNDKKDINDLLTKDLINKMTLISPIPKQNLPKKKIIIENLVQEKEESFDEKEEDLSPEEEDSNDDSSDIEELKRNVQIKNDKNLDDNETNKKNLDS